MSEADSFKLDGKFISLFDIYLGWGGFDNRLLLFVDGIVFVLSSILIVPRLGVLDKFMVFLTFNGVEISISFFLVSIMLLRTSVCL